MSEHALRLTFLGHSTVLLEMDGRRILTDPVLLDRKGPLRRVVHSVTPDMSRGVDLVLVSHLHLDHFDLDSLRLTGSDVPLIVPIGAGSLLHRLGFRRVVELRPGAARQLGPIAIVATEAAHGGYRPPFGPRAAAVGYVIESPTMRAYFAGDTDLFPGMAELGPLDVALLPVWGWGPNLGRGHLNPERAARAVRLLRPRWVIPIHWGTLWPLGLGRVSQGRLTDPPHEFAALSAVARPESSVIIVQPGETITFELNGSITRPQTDLDSR